MADEKNVELNDDVLEDVSGGAGGGAQEESVNNNNNKAL